MKKTAIITGASGNLGKATVEKFAADGYKVIAIVQPGETLSLKPGQDVETFEADVTREKEVEGAIHKITARYQNIDVALLLVGGFAAGTIQETDGARLKEMYTLNFETAYYSARPVFLQMQKQPSGGRIVLVGARPALIASAGKNLLAYGLSKSLLFKLSEYLNAEGAKQNIITSVIVPSVIDTPSNRKSNPDADFTSWVTPEAIAETMAFIVSEKALPLRDPVFKLYGRS